MFRSLKWPPAKQQMFFRRKNKKALLELNEMTNAMELKAKNPFALKTKVRARISIGAVKLNLTSASIRKRYHSGQFFSNI
jgi:oxalate decarboxylase/phosphoglucose isomerase-like protein (cupin superfamily)